MANHENEKQSILDRLGDEVRKILEEEEIDVKTVVEKVLEEKEWEFEVTRKKQHIELKNLPDQDVLTSELVQLCALPGDNSEYSQELQRRLSLLEFTDEQKETFVALDLDALEKKDSHIRKEVLALGYHILSSTTVESLPDPKSCLTSELLMVVDDANAAWVRGHKWLSDETLEAVSLVRGKYHYDREKQDWVVDDKGPFMEELERRFDLMGLELWQRSSFIKNECLITARAKWGYSPEEKSWTQEAIEKEEKAEQI